MRLDEKKSGRGHSFQIFSTQFRSAASGGNHLLDRLDLTELTEPAIGEIVAGTVGWPAGRIHLAVRTHRDLMPLNFAATVTQIEDQFLAGIQLSASRLAAIEVADEANA